MTKPKRGRGRPPSDNPKLKVVVYLEPDLIENIDTQASKAGTTRSEFVAMIMKRSIHRRIVKESL